MRPFTNTPVLSLQYSPGPSLPIPLLLGDLWLCHQHHPDQWLRGAHPAAALRAAQQPALLHVLPPGGEHQHHQAHRAGEPGNPLSPLQGAEPGAHTSILLEVLTVLPAGALLVSPGLCTGSTTERIFLPGPPGPRCSGWFGNGALWQQNMNIVHLDEV